jgi:hypothetical protein
MSERNEKLGMHNPDVERIIELEAEVNRLRSMLQVASHQLHHQIRLRPAHPDERWKLVADGCMESCILCEIDRLLGEEETDD